LPQQRLVTENRKVRQADNGDDGELTLHRSMLDNCIQPMRETWKRTRLVV